MMLIFAAIIYKLKKSMETVYNEIPEGEVKRFEMDAVDRIDYQ